jgi:hypothetical protein
MGIHLFDKYLLTPHLSWKFSMYSTSKSLPQQSDQFLFFPQFIDEKTMVQSHLQLAKIFFGNKSWSWSCNQAV